MWRRGPDRVASSGGPPPRAAAIQSCGRHFHRFPGETTEPRPYTSRRIKGSELESERGERLAMAGGCELDDLVLGDPGAYERVVAQELFDRGAIRCDRKGRAARSRLETPRNDEDPRAYISS